MESIANYEDKTNLFYFPFYKELITIKEKVFFFLYINPIFLI